ncbi:unnamed protein product [Timema podura]|uniref:Uncharacterized protein n=1 Tax=Timema podura TaxID=61482 RepID=A0ABN7PA00_TIMPD|nr:unnamed protein product [Timema podura]
MNTSRCHSNIAGLVDYKLVFYDKRLRPLPADKEPNYYYFHRLPFCTQVGRSLLNPYDTSSWAHFFMQRDGSLILVDNLTATKVKPLEFCYDMVRQKIGSVTPNLIMCKNTEFFNSKKAQGVKFTSTSHILFSTTLLILGMLVLLFCK